MAIIASDADNPNFVGAHNPDSRLAVRFYVRAVPNEFESQAQGRPIFADVNYVEIFVPGDNNTVIDQPVREDHKTRFPIQWAHFMNKHGGDAREIGTPLSQWPRVTLSQVEELRAMKFFTVDAIANASDAQIQKIGMVAGMSPYAFRDMAANFLKLADNDAAVTNAEKRANEEEQKRIELERKLAENNAKLAEMQAQIAQLLEAKSASKPGRKPKNDAE